MAIAIVTDSTSDITPQRAAALGIDVVPLFVVFGDRSYRDYVDLSRDEFYHKLETEKTLPTTSQPSSAMFADAFRPHVAAGDAVLCLTIASQLSGTINAARAAAAEFPGARIEVVDSQSVAGGLGLLAMHANERARGGMSMEALLADLDRQRASARFFACLRDLGHIARTGRIGRAQAAIGSLMKIVPVLTLRDGIVTPEAQVRTFARAQETMLDLLLRDVVEPSKARFLALHTRAPQLAEGAAARLRERLGGEPAFLEVWEAGPVIATHGGEGAVGMFLAQG